MEQLNTFKLNIDRFLQEVEGLIESDKAYGSSITLLTCQVDTRGSTVGRFRDAWNNRIFDYNLNSKGLSYKPSLNLSAKLDSQTAVILLETYSAGYLSAFSHLDSVKKRTKKPKCGNTNYNCGLSCIGVTKNCQIDGGLISRDRINKLQKLAEAIAFDQVKLKGIGRGLIKPSDLIKLSRELQKQRVTGTRALSNFGVWNKTFTNNKNEPIDTLAKEEAVKDFLTPKKHVKGQLVAQEKKPGVVSFYKGLQHESAKVRPYNVRLTSASAISDSDQQELTKSITQLGFNLAMPLVCLTNEEDEYAAVTGTAITKTFDKANMSEDLWVTVIPTEKKNALLLADDYIQQSNLNVSNDVPELKTSKEEAVKQIYFDPKARKGSVTFYKKEAPQPGYIVLNSLKQNTKTQKYSEQMESEINVAAKSIRKLGTNLSAPLVCLTGKDDEYQMLSGEPLLEAARRAGLERLRVMVLPTTPEYAAHFVKDFEVQNRVSREKSQ